MCVCAHHACENLGYEESYDRQAESYPGVSGVFSQFNLLAKQHLTRLNDYTVVLFTNTSKLGSIPLTCGREEWAEYHR